MAKAGKRASGTGSISQRASDGLWVGAFLLRSGKRKYVYARSQAALVGKLADAQANDKAGRPATPERQTVAAYLRGWLDDSAKKKLRPRVWADYNSIVSQHIDPIIGRIAGPPGWWIKSGESVRARRKTRSYGSL